MASIPSDDHLLGQASQLGKDGGTENNNLQALAIYMIYNVEIDSYDSPFGLALREHASTLALLSGDSVTEWYTELFNRSSHYLILGSHQHESHQVTEFPESL